MGYLRAFQTGAQTVVLAIVAVAAVAMTGLSVAAAAGAVPWVELPLSWGGAALPHAGMAAQVGLTVLLLMLSAFFPSNVRVMRLEAAHRDFAVGMEDVARAYWAAHRADRTGVFRLSREFDAIRERFHFLRTHPDLDDLDPRIVELASQMSFESRELARGFSDEKVARAREMLGRRREEVERMTDRIALARSATGELRRLLDDVETDEAVVQSQVSRLRADLGDLLASIGAEAGDVEERRAMIRVAPAE